MSRLTSMSPEAIKAVFSPDSDADLILLLTIYDPDNPNTVVARLADGFTKRISETADEVVYGVTSRGNDFTFLPMEISLPTEEEAQAPRCSVTMHDVTRYVVPIIRSISGPPKVKLEIVLSKTPDTVEASFAGFYFSNFTMHSFSPVYFPGIF